MDWLRTNKEKLNFIDAALLKYSSHYNSAPRFLIKCDDIVLCVEYKWNKWFRGRVVAHNEKTNTVEVIAIDYGHTMDMPVGSVYPLLDEKLAQITPVHNQISHKPNQRTKMEPVRCRNSNEPAQHSFTGRHSPSMASAFDDDENYVSSAPPIPFVLSKVVARVQRRQMPPILLSKLYDGDGADAVEKVFKQAKADSITAGAADEISQYCDFDFDHSGSDSTITNDPDNDHISDEETVENSVDSRVPVSPESEAQSKRDSLVCTHRSSATVPDWAMVGSKESGAQDNCAKTPQFLAKNVRGDAADSDGYETDATRRNCFDFNDASDLSRCTSIDDVPLSYQCGQLLLMEKNAIPCSTVPLTNLDMPLFRISCIGAAPIAYDQSKCFENLLPHIADQLKERQQISHMQSTAWHHLLDGRSAIIVCPTIYLADLVYLPVICTLVQVKFYCLIARNRSISLPIFRKRNCIPSALDRSP